MAEFSETIRVLVQSVFDSKGFDQLERRMATLMSTRDNLQKQFDRGIGMKNISNEVDQIKDKFTEAGLEIETFDNSIQEMFDAEDSEEKANQIVDSSAIEQNVGVAKDQLQELGFAVKDMDTGQVVNTGEMASRLADASNRLDKFGGFDQQNMMAGVLPDEKAVDRTLGESLQNFSLPENMDLRDNLAQTLTFDKDIDVAEGFPQDNIQGVGPDLNKGPDQFSVEGANVRTLGVLSTGMAEVGEAANTATTGVQRFSQNSLPEMDRSLGRVAQSTRGLQMRLLGLQFTMLTVAFIFGGVMASALGAVGAFQILGNTLKFLFLPTALDLLDPLLNLQDFVFGLDEETRRFIGTVFGAISVISIAIGLFAALGQPIVGLIGTLLRLSSAFNILSKLGSSIVFLSRFGQTAAGLSGILSTVGGSIGTLLTFFSSAGATASGFSGILGVLGGSLSGLLPGIMAVGSALLSLAGPILAIIGILVGLFVVFKRFPGLANGIVKAVTGAFDFLFKYLKMVINSIVSIFKGLFNILTGLFTAGLALITGDFEKAFRGLQEVLFGLGQVFVEPFENALNFIGNTIIPAFGDTGETILKTLANAILSNGSALINALISVLPDSLEKDSGGNFNVENLNTSLNVNEGNESPRETSRKAGRELRRGMVNKGSNFATGT